MMDGNKIATVGMFDGVHRGHRALLERLHSEARQRGASTAVFTFDRHPLALIAPERVPATLMSLSDKIKALKESGADQIEVLHFDNDLRSLTARQFLK
ncbi:MAG: riboflavin biosynthesis protein RibF, partial [Muribaculaceae bacterium]|nr:riboflavin biosynthesis protein RibF [Muribaculaceae bacterium]